MLVLIGLLPASYALNLKEASGAREAQSAAASSLKVDARRRTSLPDRQPGRSTSSRR